MPEERKHGRMTILAFLTTGPCRHRPGMTLQSGRTITSCPGCPDLMWAGECKRDKLRGTINGE